MIDLHTHHERCGHAQGRLEDYVRTAVVRGVRIFGVSDHAPLFASAGNDPAPGMHMPKAAFASYLEEAAALRERYRTVLDLRIGVEADHLENGTDAYDAPLADPRLDYRLGAVHYFGGFHVYDPRRWQEGPDPDEVHATYYRAVAQAASSGRYEVLAHIDAVKARGTAPTHSVQRARSEMVEAIAASGVAVEVNASGFRKCGEAFPSPALIEDLHRAGVPFTYGSDAHAPSEVGHAFDDVVAQLLAVGVRRLASWSRRERVDVEIADLVDRRR